MKKVRTELWDTGKIALINEGQRAEWLGTFLVNRLAPLSLLLSLTIPKVSKFQTDIANLSS